MTATLDGQTTATSLAPRAAAGGILAFALIGAHQALYGPAVPAVRTEFGISAGAAGMALSLHFLGAIAGVLVMPAARRRGCSDGVFLAASLVLMAVGCLVFVAAPSWLLALVGVLLAGLGFGGVDGGVNQIFTETYRGTGGHGMLNLLHGCFGIGAIIGPVGIAILPTYHVAFLLCTVVAMIALPLLLPLGRHRVTNPSPGPRRAAFGLLGTTVIAFFVVHVGLETGAGGWETTHLMSTGMTETAAATATSGFWLAFTAVRFIIAPFCRWLSTRSILLGCTALTVVAAAATMADPLAPWAYALLGVAVGPLFPTGVAWLGNVRPALIPTVVAVSMAGGVLLPPAIGVAVQTGDPGAIPWTLTAAAAVCLATLTLLIRLNPAGPTPGSEMD